MWTSMRWPLFPMRFLSSFPPIFHLVPGEYSNRAWPKPSICWPRLTKSPYCPAYLPSATFPRAGAKHGVGSTTKRRFIAATVVQVPVLQASCQPERPGCCATPQFLLPLPHNLRWADVARLQSLAAVFRLMPAGAVCHLAHFPMQNRGTERPSEPPWFGPVVTVQSMG